MSNQQRLTDLIAESRKSKSSDLAAIVAAQRAELLASHLRTRQLLAALMLRRK